MQVLLASFLAVVAFASALSAGIEPYNPDITCYGEALDVRMIAENRDDEIAYEVILNLPYQEAWWGVVLPNRENLRYADCLPEPIDVRQIGYGGFRSAQSNPAGFPKGFRWLGISAYANLDTSLRHLPKHIKQFEAEGMDLEAGFRWIGRTQERDGDYAAALGWYMFPRTHVSAIGNPVFRSCNTWVCRGSYGLTDNLIVRFEFWNIVPYQEWVEHDLEFQRVLKPLIKGYD